MTAGRPWRAALTPAATEGIYLAESFCCDKGEFVGYGKDNIEIKKVGLAKWLTETYQNHSDGRKTGVVIKHPSRPFKS
jgi:hypothetical protein